jgi:hypothetical protein
VRSSCACGGELLSWFSTNRPIVTGEAFPTSAKHFPGTARALVPGLPCHGECTHDARGRRSFAELPRHFPKARLPGLRRHTLNPVAAPSSFPKDVASQLPASWLDARALLETLRALDLDSRGQAIMTEVLPETSAPARS